MAHQQPLGAGLGAAVATETGGEIVAVDVPSSTPRPTAAAVAVSGTGAALLRRLAAETPQPDTQAHPPYHRWYVETLDDLAGEWAPGMRFTDRDEAVERYQTVTQRHPTWKDSTPVKRRFVRETTTYTVEPEPQPATARPDDTTGATP